MKSAVNLVLGRPRVALAPSRLLSGEVTTPYGNIPGDDLVSDAWRAEAGDRDCPPWMILGRRDAPSGTIWRLAWCPPAGPLPEGSEIVLPQAAWALECMNATQGPQGWHLRSLESPFGFWIGLWEGSRCEHLQPPSSDRDQALRMERALATKRGGPLAQELLSDWTAPEPRDLALLADASPESDLLDAKASLVRNERRAWSCAFARVALVLAVLAMVCGALGALQVWQARERHAQESRLAAVESLVERSSELETVRSRLIDTLLTFQDALHRSEAADLVVAAIAAQVPAGAHLQALALEESAAGWRLRTDARLPDWDAIQPFTQALRKIPAVSKVSVANQARQADAISAVVEIEGRWP